MNGEKYPKAFLKHSDIMLGGNLTFIMSEKESISFENDDLPTSIISDEVIIPLPSILGAKRVFRDSTRINIEAIEGAKILYSLNDSEEKEYTEVFVLKEETILKMRAVKGDKSSKVAISHFNKIPKGRSIAIKNKWHKQYSASGKDALIDGVTGAANFRTGDWQGYYFDDLEAVIDLGNNQKISSIKTNFIQDANSWIWMPEYVEYWGSVDSNYFFPLRKVKNDASKQDYTVLVKTFETNFYPKQIKYIKLFAKNHNVCPKGHIGEGSKGFIFADEVVME